MGQQENQSPMNNTHSTSGPQRHTAALRLAWRIYWREAKRYKLCNIVAVLFPAIGTTLVMYVPPLIIAKILVRYSSGQALTLHQLLPYLVSFIAIWSSGELAWRIGIQCAGKAQVHNLANLYNDALAQLTQKDIKFFHDNFAGSLTKKAIGYAKRYEDVFDNFAFNIMPNIIPIPFIGVILWRFSPWLVVVLFSLLIVTFLAIFPLIKRRQKLVAARETASNVMAGYLADVIANMDAVKAFAHEDYELAAHARYVHDFMTKTKRAWDYHNLRIDTVTSPFYVVTNAAGLILAITVSHGVGFSMQAVFITFSFYATITRVMWDFNRLYRTMESSISEVAEFTELLLDKPRLTDSNQPSQLVVKKGEIDFKNVSFRYHDNANEHLFSGLNLHVNSGEKVALVGHSGGGKTTITKLLLRFMDVSGGQISIDGQDIAQVSQAALRSNIAYVPQEPIMFHRSLADNIRYGRLEAGQAQVETVAKLAHAHEFIVDLPHGYDTLVGERGVKLSGGQRQRVAVARAMIKNAPILVLDEATSALDSESEILIQQALWKLMEGRTAIVIAHRLSTIQRMDRIVVLDKGQIAEQGSHHDLLKQNGIYAKLWAHQSGGFIED